MSYLSMKVKNLAGPVGPLPKALILAAGTLFMQSKRDWPEGPVHPIERARESQVWLASSDDLSVNHPDESNIADWNGGEELLRLSIYETLDAPADWPMRVTC